MTSKFTNYTTNFSKLKTKKSGGYKNVYEEEELSLKDIKRDRQHKQYRNYENALRSKDVNRLLSYDDE
jgi:hypothetical protein